MLRPACLGLTLLAAGPAVSAGLSQPEAIALAFPGAKVERHEHFLTEAQQTRVKELAGTEMRTRFVVAYEARRDDELVGVAFFDTHVVRTLPETAMVAVSSDGRIIRVEVIQFREPDEYRAPAAWTKQLAGKGLTPGLSLKAEIRPLSGASLTAAALVDSSRRMLALFQLLYARKQPP